MSPHVEPERSRSFAHVLRLSPQTVWVLCAVLIVAAAAGLRLVHPTADGPGYLDSTGFLVSDEGWYTMRAAQQYLGITPVIADLNTVPHTPLFHLWVRGAFAIFGVHIYSVRILNIVAGCITVGLLCLVDRSRPWVGLLAASLVAVDYNHMMFARIGGSEPLQVMFATLSLVCFIRADRRPVLHVPGVLAAIAAGLTKTNGFIFVGVYLFAQQLSWPGGWRQVCDTVKPRLRGLALPGLVAAVCLALWWWGWVHPHMDAFHAMNEHTVTARFPDSPLKLLRNIAAFFVIPPLAPRSYLLLALGTGGLLLAWRTLLRSETTSRPVAFSVAWLTLVGGMIGVYSYQPERYCLLLVPALAVLTTHVADHAVVQGFTERHFARALLVGSLWVLLAKLLKFNHVETLVTLVTVTLAVFLLRSVRGGKQAAAWGLVGLSLLTVAEPYWRWAHAPRYSLVEVAEDVRRRVEAVDPSPCLMGDPAATLALVNHLRTTTTKYGEIGAKWRDCQPTHLIMSSIEHRKLREQIPDLDQHLELVATYMLYENYDGEPEPGDRLYRVRPGFQP